MPPSVDKVEQIKRYTAVLEGDPLRALLVPNANHKVDDSEAQDKVCEAVIDFLSNLGE